MIGLSNKALLLIAAFSLLGIGLSGCINPVPNPVVNSTSDTYVTTTLPRGVLTDKAFEDFLVNHKQRRLFTGNDSFIPDRVAYGIPSEVFVNLPAFPKDFLYITYLIKMGKFYDIGNLNESYWKQPEFDPDFSRMGLKYWQDIKNADFKKTHWSTSGVRSYPYEQFVASKPGYSFNVTVILSADWSVEAYQGVKISPKFLDEALVSTGTRLVSNPDAAQFIHVNVTPDEFILEPAFPIFSRDWNKKLTFTGKISENTPPGTYILSFDMVEPSKANSERWFLQYLNLYSEGAQMIKTDKPYLQAVIYVSA